MSGKGSAAKLTRFWPKIRPNDVSRFRSANYKPRNSQKQLILAESVLKVLFMRTTVPVSWTTFYLLLHQLGSILIMLDPSRVAPTMSWAERPQSVCLFGVDGAVNYGLKWVVMNQVTIMCKNTTLTIIVIRGSSAIYTKRFFLYMVCH